MSPLCCIGNLNFVLWAYWYFLGCLNEEGKLKAASWSGDLTLPLLGSPRLPGVRGAPGPAEGRLRGGAGVPGPAGGGHHCHAQLLRCEAVHAGGEPAKGDRCAPGPAHREGGQLVPLPILLTDLYRALPTLQAQF